MIATNLSALFLLMCLITFFTGFGTFIMMTIFYSWLSVGWLVRSLAGSKMFLDFAEFAEISRTSLFFVENFTYSLIQAAESGLARQ